jgi:hypothetical protein
MAIERPIRAAPDPGVREPPPSQEQRRAGTAAGRGTSATSARTHVDGPNRACLTYAPGLFDLRSQLELNQQPPNRGMNLTRSQPPQGTAGLPGYPQCSTDQHVTMSRLEVSGVAVDQARPDWAR